MSDQSDSAIIRFGNENLALTFCEYLKQQGIKTQIHQTTVDHATAFVVVIDDSRQRELALRIAQEFVANPQATKFQQAAWQLGKTYDSIKMPALSINMRALLKVPFTSLIVFVCLLIFTSFFLGFFPRFTELLSMQTFTQLAQNHQWWRIIGPNFIHYSIAHIAFNLLWWWILGTRLERIFGTIWLVILFITASFFANVSQLLATGPNFGGMSGVVYALFGFVWWVGWLRPNWRVSLPKAYIGLMLVWLLLGFADILPFNMANQAHLFGLISGCLMAGLLHLWVGKRGA